MTSLAPKTFPNYDYAERMEYVASVTHKEERGFTGISRFSGFDQFLLIQKFAMSNPLIANKNRISEISNLNDNWDGYGAVAPDKEVVNNSFRFLDTLAKLDVNNIASDDIYPMPYGSIVMELNSPNGMVSIEIGKHKIGFFTEFSQNEDFSSGGEDTDFRSVPGTLREAIRILRYGR